MITSLFCDGGCVLKNPSDIGITWAWVAVESLYTLDEKDKIFIPNGIDHNAKYIKSDSGFIANYNDVKLTNNVAEYAAMVYALESMEDGWSGTVYSDSLITLGRFFEGWKNKGLEPRLVARKNKVLNRLGKVSYRHLDGHPTKAHLSIGKGKRGNPVSKWNVMVDELCNKESLNIQGRIMNDRGKSILQY